MNPENESDSFFSKFKETPGPVPQAAPVPGAPVVPTAPAEPARADVGKMAALEAAVGELKEELAALKGAAWQAAGADPSVRPEAQLVVRLERSENLIAELKVLVSSQQAQLNKYAEAKLVAEGLSEYLRDLVAQLNTKLAEAVNIMHLSLAEMSARLTGGEAIHKKMFSGAEDRLRKSLGGEITAINAQLKKQREDIVWLSDEYKIVMVNKVRVLEEKISSVLEAIAKRMAR